MSGTPQPSSGRPEDVFAAVLFDAPGLVAARLSRARTLPAAARFALSRQPDAGGGRVPGRTMALVGLAAAGIAVVGVGLLVNRALTGPSRRAFTPPAVVALQAADARGATDWKAVLPSLAEAWRPARADLLPWFQRALLDVPRDLARETADPAGGWLAPACAAAERAAFDAAARLAGVLAQAGADRELAVVLDLPGPSSVAAAAGLARVLDPVVAMDNLPHPRAVVPAAQALAAFVYWRPVVAEAGAARPAQAGPAFVLEGNRLAPYGNEPDRFDNRSRARLPDAAALARLGVRRVLHVREKPGEVAEAEDLNEIFCAWQEAGIEVRHLALLTLAAEAPPAVAAGNAQPGERDPAASPWRTWFLNAYGWHHTPWLTRSAVADPDAAYRSIRRPAAPPAAAALDGGLSRRASALDALHPPAARAPSPPSAAGRRPSPSSGGSWGRSHSSSFSG